MEHQDLSMYEQTSRRHSANLSGPAFVKLTKLSRELKADPTFNHRTSRSVLIEFLIWFHETGGKEPVSRFSPYTRPQGRPRKGYQGRTAPSEEAVRPSDVKAEVQRLDMLDRKAARSRLRE